MASVMLAGWDGRSHISVAICCRRQLCWSAVVVSWLTRHQSINSGISESYSARWIGSSGRAAIWQGQGLMKLLLTSDGITNMSIRGALIDLLGKPIAESSALCIPTAAHAMPGGAGMAWRMING